MGIPIWLSVDFDYFVRSLPEFDWGHSENAFFQSGMMWMIRVASQHFAGGDLREAMDPEKWAQPKVSTFFDVLQQLGYDFSKTEYTIMADSHAVAGPIFSEIGKRAGAPELVVSFDAHHDLGYHGWSRTKQIVDEDRCSCDMWLCAILCWYEQLKARIIYPPWQTKKDLGWERKQIRENIPKKMQPRVRADLFSHDGVVSPLVRPPKGKRFDVKALFICRSSAWVPPWLDETFNEFITTVEDLGLSPFAPFAAEGRDADPTEVRSDFDYDSAVQQGEQMRQMMELGPDGFRKMVEELGSKSSEENEPEENPEPKGDCFRWAFNKAKEWHGEPDATVVHAVVSQGGGMKSFWHAWVERDGRIFDVNTQDGEIDVDTAYRVWSPTNVHRYTTRETINNSFRHGHYGPWENSKPEKNPEFEEKNPLLV